MVVCDGALLISRIDNCSALHGQVRAGERRTSGAQATDSPLLTCRRESSPLAHTHERPQCYEGDVILAIDEICVGVDVKAVIAAIKKRENKSVRALRVLSLVVS